MSSMADLTRNLGWIAWCLTVIGWFLSPIISLLVNKLFAYLVFDTSKKLKELENEIIRNLKKRLSAAEELTVLKAAEDKESQNDLKILDSMKMDLKSALYEAEDILDLLDYRRIEKDLHHVDDDSVWVKSQLAAARRKGSWIGRWINSTFAQSWWRPSMQNIKIVGAAVLQFAQSWYQQLGQLLKRVALRRSGVLLPVSTSPTCSEFVPAEPAFGPAEGMVHGEERVEVIDKWKRPKFRKRKQKILERIQKFFEREVGKTSEEKIKEDSVEEKEGIFLYCARYMLTWFAKACFYRDWSYGIVGIKSDKMDANAVESLVGIAERNSLKNRIKRIEDILNSSKNSDLWNDMNSSSSTTKDNDNESSSERKEIDMMHRSIDQKVFGRDKDRAHICNMLRDGPDANAASSSTSKPYSVIVIYGITGSGKTTLAQYICDNEKHAGHFDLIMFIHLGKTFRICDIFRDMLYQIKEQNISDTESIGRDRSLQAELREKLKDKCFLLVLDDLWVIGDDMKEREILLDVFGAGQSGSRILVTAQKKDAAAALGSQKQIKIPNLEQEQYLSMFMHYAQVSQVTNTDLERYKALGRKIIKKVLTSPITGKTVAARLQSNNSIDDWQRIANDDLLNETMRALWWSYQQLGVDIRRCFAYCSTFPGGYEFRRDELVRIWIAQGFVNIRSNAKEELEDVGQRYFDELLTFSFLQASFKKAETFTIHDLLHELAERVSGSEFFRIGLNGLLPKDIPRGVHHLFIETDSVAEINEKILDLGNLHTLIIVEKVPYYAHPMCNSKKDVADMKKFLGRLFMRLRKLRVLIIKLYSPKYNLSVPVSIYHMKHLRYLCFGHSVGWILPSTFSKLYQIQVIYTGWHTSYPEDMGANLLCLRHLCGRLRWPIPNIGNLTSLQTLPRFIVAEGEGYELKQLMHMNKLRGTLKIWGLDIVKSKEEALEADLKHKERLQILELHFEDIKEHKRFGKDEEAEEEVLEGLCPPMNLEKLRISHYMGSTYPTWMLSPCHPDTPKQLHTLELHRCSQLASIPEDSQLFIGLLELRISSCDWDSLPQNMERLLSLQTLKIMSCDNIELLPPLPLHSLKKIIIYFCERLSITCKTFRHKNWFKIQDIPEIEINGYKFKVHRIGGHLNI